MTAHAPYDGIDLASGPLFGKQPLLDFKKEGTAVKLVGTSEVAGVPAYELELKFADGKVNQLFIDTKNFLLLKHSFSYSGPDENGKTISVSGAYRYFDYKMVAGRMFNHSFEWENDGKIENRSTIERISFDQPLDPEIFAMPK